MKQGYTENASIVHDVSEDGVVTRLHFEGDTITVQRSYDAQPHLARARLMRECQDGKSWGEGKHIGHIPPAEYARILTLPTREARQKAVLAFLRQNPAFVGFSRFLKK